MKIYLFVFVFGLISCENAIKNKVEPIYLAENSIVEKPIRNNNTIINSKEDLIGYWVYDFQDYDETKYYGKFIFSFSKVDKNKIYGKLFINEQQMPIVMDLNEGDQKIMITYQNNSKNLAFKKIEFDVIKGTKQLEGKISVLDSEKNIENYKIEMIKKFFVYEIEGHIENMYVDEGKTGKGYREYNLVRENDLVEEILVVDTIREKTTKEKIEIKPTRVEREGYFATTNDIFKINPSKELIKKEVVENLSKADLYILNKLIYAKHGKIFNEKKLREYFLNHSWYLPVSNNVDSDLTEIEKKNIDLLQRYEQNAKVYYQVFGR
jgi:hypothetical protein